MKDAVGYPDLTLAKDNRVLWFELKAEDGVLSKAQMRWKMEIGPNCMVIRPSDITRVAGILT